VLGDMLELGREAEALHAGLANAIVASGVSRVHLVGHHMTTLAATLPPQLVASQSATSNDAVEPIMAELAYGDAVMVKGSNGVGLARVVNAISARFGQS
jgi:UDP-N-acetylmuramoyl-tripeptide--D-alanyl-D-alanine ligase